MILEICGTEQQTLCAGVPLGGGRMITCLADNAPRLSPQCYAALARAREVNARSYAAPAI